MTCTHRFDVDDMCIDCGYDDGLRYMQPTQAVLRLAALPRPAGEQHDMEPPHDLCLGDDPCICDRLRACEQRVLAEREAEGPWFRSVVHDCCVDKQTAYAAGLDAAREAVAALHQRLPVIECACGWGKDCPECGSESNRVLGYACAACCTSFGDHAYCEDMHYDDDTSLHHQDGLMWSGPHCPTMAAIDALRRESDV